MSHLYTAMQGGFKSARESNHPFHWRHVVLWDDDDGETTVIADCKIFHEDYNMPIDDCPVASRWTILRAMAS